MDCKLYITNNKKVARNIARVLSAVPVQERLQRADNSGERIFIANIEGDFGISFNTVGRCLLKFNDEKEEINVCVEYFSLQDIKLVKSVLKENDVSEIINTCDPNSSGQYTFDVLMKCINIDTYSERVKRLWLTHMNITRDDLDNIKLNRQFKNLYYSMLCENIMDYYWLYKSEDLFGYKISTNLKELMILTLIKDREKEIERQVNSSKTKSSFSIMPVINGLKFKLSSRNFDLITTQEEIEYVVNSIKGKEVLITNITKTATAVPHPLLYNTVDLIRDAKSMNNITLDEIKDSLYSLYTSGYITNPNTTSNHIPVKYLEDYTREILKGLYKNPKYSKYIKYIEDLGACDVDSRVCDDKLAQTNLAIVPTIKIPALADITDTQEILYSMITKRFLSVFMGSSDKVTITIDGIIDNNTYVRYEKTQELDTGWRLLSIDYTRFEHYVAESRKPGYIEKAFSDINMEKAIKYPIEDIIIESNVLKNKLRYTVSSLINALQYNARNIRGERKKISQRDLGIGVEENKGLIITSMVNNKLIEIEDDRVSMTPKGENLLNNAPLQLIKKEHLIQFNKSIKNVQLGLMSIKEAIQHHTAYINAFIKNKHNDSSEVNYREIIEKYKCPFCYSEILDRPDRLKCCRCHFHIPKDMYGYTLQREHIEKLIEVGITDMIEGFIFKGGKISNGKGRLRLDGAFKKPKIYFDT